MNDKLKKIEDAIKHLIVIDILLPKNFQKTIIEKMGANKTSVSQALKGNERYLTDNFIERFCEAFPEIEHIFNENTTYSIIQQGQGNINNGHNIHGKENRIEQTNVELLELIKKKDEQIAEKDKQIETLLEILKNK